ncbi:glutamate-cysteine ligase family protein [Halopelagius longus]|uniref:Glutamate--cysteine ligase n=1 Tax=Halopelagius longus TaxID=1236180 RepID=A0A1H0YWQ8_9EURY|nr:glutamate-cysteine ligase family protein [Halopelagius longus]RDI72713.1 glutamate--cysteine ligase [Halopelagius longus]SDQ19605.1 Glutamate-cysteine ligase family 2(GCS2) [Halopelagius longus]
MRIGIEIEYWLVDTDGNLRPADEVIAACEGVDSEMVTPLLEVKTPPCDSLAELTAVLGDRLGRVRDEARVRDKRLVPLGTPLSDERLPRRTSSRLAVQHAVLGDDLGHAGYCAGAHLHFEQTSVADQLRVLTALDPAFALVNTTPYYRGRRVTACARPLAYRRLCYRSVPEYGQLWRYPESAAEWRERVRRRFDAFVDAAAERGVDPDTVESEFSPCDAVWAPVCLRDDLGAGTVEWRTPDAASPLELCRLAADAVRIVETAVEDGTRIGDGNDGDGSLSLPPFATLRARVDAAIERGLAAPPVEEHLSRFGFDPDEYRPFGEEIGGRERLDADDARRIRLRAADRLERDVERLRGTATPQTGVSRG